MQQEEVTTDTVTLSQEMLALANKLHQMSADAENIAAGYVRQGRKDVATSYWERSKAWKYVIGMIENNEIL
jgi:hypothetical protein